MNQSWDEERDKAHYATGTADLAIKHRDEAEARVEELTRVLTTVHNWLANTTFNEADLPEALSIGDLVQTTLRVGPHRRRK